MTDTLASNVHPNANGQGAGRAPSELSFLNALPYFVSIGIFPLVAAATIYGGWWLAGPFVFLWIFDHFETAFGTDELNFDPNQQGGQLFGYNLAVWSWVALYPITFVFAFSQVFATGHLALWEDILIVLALGGMARLTLNVGHDMMHRRTWVERRIGEIVMASVSFPQEITEHVYVHHAHIGTPADAVSAPKGQSFWQYLPKSVFRSYRDTWIVERDRLAHRRLPVWHYTNPVWRYILETAACYALAYWIGGAWGLLVFMAICAMGIFQLRMVDYIQHYGLQRIRLPGRRFERVRPRHSWSVAYKLPNWFYYNAQRHADHHMSATRLYPLLQHSGPDEAPQLPGSYSDMGNLVLRPKRWFEKMDPLVDQWRALFYPEIDDWSAYDSAAYLARPDSYEEIDEIHRAAPRLAAWINRDPNLLDSLRSREFTDLDLPEGFGPDPEFETQARRGLARAYWNYELNVTEMQAMIADVPVRNVREATEAARNWSNDKVFQICLHVIRGNLSPSEAGTALSNIAEATISTVMSAVIGGVSELRSGDGLVAVMLGDLASRDVMIGAEPDLTLLCERSPTKRHEAMFRRFREALQALSMDNLLLSPVQSSQESRIAHSLNDFPGSLTADPPGSEIMELARARCIFAYGESGIDGRFEEARLKILTHGAVRSAMVARLEQTQNGAAKPEFMTISDAPGGFLDVQRAARLLQFKNPAATPEILAPDTPSVFRVAGDRGLVTADVAERLATAAELWRNLRGIMRLVLEDGQSMNEASSTSKATVARACSIDDFEALPDIIRETAERAASDIRALVG